MAADSKKIVFLKNKAGKRFLTGCNFAADGLPGAWRRGHLDKTVEHLANAEIIDGTAKEHRGLAGLQIMFILKGVSRAF